MDIVFIQGLKIDTVIGIYDWEREIRQEIVLDLEMSADIKAASETDHIDQTLDYRRCQSDWLILLRPVSFS